MNCVTARELLVADRRGWWPAGRRVYAIFLVGQFYFHFSHHLAIMQIRSRYRPAAAAGTGVEEFIVHCLLVFEVQQFLLLTALTLLAVAGNVAAEKARGTLPCLLITDLSAAEIVAGKCLSHWLNAAFLSLTGLPFVVFLVGYGHLGGGVLLALAIHPLVFAFGLTAACTLASVLSDRKEEAALRICAWGGVLILVAWGANAWLLPSLLASNALPLGAEPLLHGIDTALCCLNPLYFLGPLVRDGDGPAALAYLLCSSAEWGLLGGACLVLAARRLRPAYARQFEYAVLTRLAYTKAARAPLVDDPVFWRESEFEDLVASPALRPIVTRLAYAAIVLWTVVLQFLGQGKPGVLWTIDLFVCFAASLLVAVRCAFTVCSERDRHTWDALLLTDLEVSEILRGKLRATTVAVLPYLLAYTIAAAAGALCIEPASLVRRLLVLGSAVPGLYAIGAIGIRCSIHNATTWASLLATLLGGYCMIAIVYVVAAPVTGILAFWMGGSFLRYLVDGGELWLILFLAGSAAAFVKIAQAFLERAEWDLVRPDRSA